MSQKRDLTGKRFGRLTAIRPTDKRDSNGSSYGSAAVTAEMNWK